MNPDTLVVVHCYEGDKPLVENFLPVFVHHQRPVLVLSPEDSQVHIDFPGVSNASAGEAGWKGQHTVLRQIEHWRLALQYDNSQWFLLNDADSMCLDPELPEFLYQSDDILWCNVLCHENEHRADDHPNLNPPYFMHRKVLQRLLDTADAIGEMPPEAFTEPRAWGEAIDGFYTYLTLDVLRAPYADYPNGITTWPRGRSDLFKFVQNEGAIMLHGVKSASDLGMLLSYRQLYNISSAVGSSGTLVFTDVNHPDERITI